MGLNSLKVLKASCSQNPLLLHTRQWPSPEGYWSVLGLEFGVFWKTASEKWKKPTVFRWRAGGPLVFGVWWRCKGLRLDVILKDKPRVFEEVVRNCASEYPLFASTRSQAHLLFLSPRSKEGVHPGTWGVAKHKGLREKVTEGWNYVGLVLAKKTACFSQQ